jgi:hypothetical protein
LTESSQVSQALDLSASDLDDLCCVDGRVGRSAFVRVAGGMLAARTRMSPQIAQASLANALHSLARTPTTPSTHAAALAVVAGSTGKQGSFETAQQEACEIARQLELLAEQHVSTCQPDLVADCHTAESALRAALTRADLPELELLVARFSGRLGAEHALLLQARRVLSGQPTAACAASEENCRFMMRCAELMQGSHDMSTIEKLHMLEEEMVAVGVTVRNWPLGPAAVKAAVLSRSFRFPHALPPLFLAHALAQLAVLGSGSVAWGVQGAKLQHVQSAKLRVSRALHAEANRQYVYELLRERLPAALSMSSTRLLDFTADFSFSRLSALRAAQRGLDGFCVRSKRVHEPLFEHGPEQNARAVSYFKQLLLFVAPSRTVVRSTIVSHEAFAHSFVRAGMLGDGRFRDELVCQLGLTLRANLCDDATALVWQLVHFSLEHFRPTAAVEPYLAASCVRCIVEKHAAHENAVHVLRLLLHIPSTAKELASAKVRVYAMHSSLTAFSAPVAKRAASPMPPDGLHYLFIIYVGALAEVVAETAAVRPGGTGTGTMPHRTGRRSGPEPAERLLPLRSSQHSSRSAPDGSSSVAGPAARASRCSPSDSVGVCRSRASSTAVDGHLGPQQLRRLNGPSQ